MKNFRSLFLLFLGLVLCISMSAEPEGNMTLMVRTDADCLWKLDGHAMGLLKAGDSAVVPVSPGEHRVRAATTDGLVVVHTKVEADQAQTVVDIQLESQHEQQLKVKHEKPADESKEANDAPTWTDPASGLMWAKKDNGSDIDWNQANSYCSSLHLADYKDWRLPAIEELQGIYDPTVDRQAKWDDEVRTDIHVKGNLKLSGWIWSSSPGNYSEAALVFAFTDAKPSAFPRGGFNYNTRGLCVRDSGD